MRSLMLRSGKLLISGCHGVVALIAGLFTTLVRWVQYYRGPGVARYPGWRLVSIEAQTGGTQ